MDTEFVLVPLIGMYVYVDFHVLPICGADVVLGVQWLKSLGPVLTDYATLTMKFISNDKLIELKGDRDTSIDQISPSQL